MTNINTIEELSSFLKKIGQRPQPINRFVHEKVHQLIGRKLPDSYEKLLQLMGSGAGGFMVGSTVFIEQSSDIIHCREAADGLSKEHEFNQLSADMFVFSVHQGYQIAWFDLSAGNNPPVYFFSEGHENSYPTMVYANLLEFLKDQLYMSFPELFPEKMI